LFLKSNGPGISIRTGRFFKIYFMYVVDASAAEPIMLLNGDINNGVQFQSELLHLDTLGKKSIKVYINSPGGEVAGGMLIYNSILKSKTKVDTYNCGVCASIAAVIFQAGRFRYMADYSVLMFHAPYYPDGEKSDPYLDATKSAIAVMVKRSGVSTEAVEKLLNNGDTFLTALEAQAAGLCDYIELSADYNAKHGNTILNSLLEGKHAANKYLTHAFHGQANAINLMADIAAKHNQS
jgi:ATP-dependent protease ClpP protease subunit